MLEYRVRTFSKQNIWDVTFVYDLGTQKFSICRRSIIISHKNNFKFKLDFVFELLLIINIYLFLYNFYITFQNLYF